MCCAAMGWKEGTQAECTAVEDSRQHRQVICSGVPSMFQTYCVPLPCISAAAQVGDEGMSLEALADAIQVDPSDIVRTLFMKGIMLSLNQVRVLLLWRFSVVWKAA